MPNEANTDTVVDARSVRFNPSAPLEPSSGAATTWGHLTTTRVTLAHVSDDLSVVLRGEEDRVTTTENTARSATEATSADSTTNEPFRLTRSILRELGSCGPYVRTFSEKFPLERYPDGVEINAETCGEHHDAFAWDWAESRMLSHAGRDEYKRIVRSRAERYQHLGTGDRRRAAAFGYVFHRHPEMRHPDMAQVRTAAQRRADQEAIQEVRNVRDAIRWSVEEIERQTKALKSNRERLPKLEAVAAGALRREAQRALTDAERMLRQQAERAERAQRTVDEARAEVERLTALEREQQATDVTREAVNGEAVNGAKSVDASDVTVTLF